MNHLRYGFQEDGIFYQDALGSTLIPWNKVKGLRKSIFSRQLYLQGNSRIPLKQNSAELEIFLGELFSRWQNIDPSAAKKAAFDYVDQNKAFYKIFLICSLGFSLIMAAAMLNEAREQYHCTQAMHENGIRTDARLVKGKKRRDGHFTLKLEFTAQDGSIIKGQDNYFDPQNTEPGATMPIIFAAKDPKCWSLANVSISSENSLWAKRRFFTAYVFLFGCFFLVFGILGAIYSCLKIREERPYREKIAALFSFS